MKAELLPTDRFHPATRRTAVVKPKKKSALADIPRFAGYALMAFIAWLLFSTLLQPWVSTSATRAILDAPATLVTSPIDGTVTALRTQDGQPVKPGETIAVVKNTTVARDALTTLLTRKLELQSRANDLDDRIQADKHMLDYIGNQYRQYHNADLAQLRSANASLSANQDAASAKLTGLRTQYWRTVALQRDGAVSAAAVTAARAQMDTAQSELDSIKAEKHSHEAAIGAAKRGVYVSSSQDGNGLLPQLAQRRTDLETSIKNEQAEADALKKQLADLDHLVGREDQRVQTLSDYAIKAYAPGTTQEIVAPVGTQVTAGATLVRVADCRKAGVVAVFPARMATRLHRGSRLVVQVSEAEGPLGAHVTNLLPTASEARQGGYATPFPYAEDGSVYALAQWDPDTPQDLLANACAPGRTVTASLR